MIAALVSLFTGRLARPDTAMTGEVSLRGHVLPIGGVREKVIAAHRAGIRRVLLPAANEKDLHDVTAKARDQLQCIRYARYAACTTSHTPHTLRELRTLYTFTHVYTRLHTLHTLLAEALRSSSRLQ